MMRGPGYDDLYLSRRMGAMAMEPPLPYGRTPSYLQDDMANCGLTLPRPYGPPSRPPPRGPPPPSYYDYDYGYGGYGYGGAPAPYYGGYPYGAPAAPPYNPYAGYTPRMSRYDSYLEPDYEVSYPHLRNRTTDLDREKIEPQREMETPSRSRLRAIEAPPSHSPPKNTLGITEGDRHLAKMQAKYPTLSEPQMLQDQVDKMRIRLKALSYSLDPSGPVPEIVVHPRNKKSFEDIENIKKSAMEMAELPRLSTRRHHYYPEDDHMKDNLGIKCLSLYKNTRTQAESKYVAPKSTPSYISYSRGPSAYQTPALPDYTPKYSSRSVSKWEEPDTIYGPSSDKKPYSKADTGDDEDDSRREKRKKKQSRELDELSATDLSAAPAGTLTTTNCDMGDDGELDEKEMKRLEKKKRKAEREAAAKAAMESELAALAQAEAELTRLEAESAATAPADAKEEEAAEK